MIFSEALTDIGEIIFPSQCLGCAEILHPSAGQIFCPSCSDEIKVITGTVCPVCGTTFPDSPSSDHLCGECLENKTYFSMARAVFRYETFILKAIHQFKYGRNISVGETLASFMAVFSFPGIDFTDYSLIIPVPLHIKKLRERGFNQSLILARAMEKKHMIPVDFSVLKRKKFTLAQAGSNRNERKKNIKDAFEVKNGKRIKGKNIILIDDVYTTGATVNECAKALTSQGADNVAVLTLARVLTG